MISCKVSESGSARSLRVLRISAGHEVDAVLVSRDPLWLSTHWFGRQVICPGDVCPACGGGGGREHGYLVIQVAHGPSRSLFLLEISAPTWARAESLASMVGEDLTTGAFVRLSRRRKNSPLMIEVEGTLKGTVAFAGADSDSSRCLDAVATLYGLPVSKTGEDASQWTDRVRHLAMVKVADAFQSVG